MLKTTRRYLRAVGSVMAIMPSTDYIKMVSDESETQIFRRDQRSINKDMKKVMNGITKKSGKNNDSQGRCR